MMKKIILILSAVILYTTAIFCQAYQEDINAFLKRDSISLPPANAVLLIGSSSFTNWKDAQDYFPKYHIINRGFGGSTLAHQIPLVGKIVDPYRPATIFIYCGENDFVTSDTVTSDVVFQRFVTLYQHIRKNNVNTTIYFISIKPSPSRWYLKDKIIKANKLVKAFMSINPKDGYIDIFDDLLNNMGLPNPDLFKDDRLHINATGYKIWAAKMNNVLDKS